VPPAPSRPPVARRTHRRVARNAAPYFALSFARALVRAIAFAALAATAATTTATAAPERPWRTQFATTLLWHDNATNGERPADIFAAAQLVAELDTTRRLVLGRDDHLIFAGRLATESWPRYDGLDRLVAGIRATWQHKFALGPFAPTARLETAADVVSAREAGRGGQAGSAALIYRQRLPADLLFQLGREVARHDARALAFDRTGRETFARLAWQPAPAWQFDTALRRRLGDVVSYSLPPRPDLLANGKKLILVDTFDRAGPLIAYYFPARSDTLELRATHALSRTQSLALAFEHRRTTHGLSSAYLNRTFSLTYHRSL
jgi:hypothetical protein